MKYNCYLHVEIHVLYIKELLFEVLIKTVYTENDWLDFDLGLQSNESINLEFSNCLFKLKHT